MQLDCTNLQSGFGLVALMSFTSWKGAEKWSINQPPLSLAYSPNIPEVQALVTLSPHLNQQILASEAHDIKGTLSSVWEPWSLEPVLPISSVVGARTLRKVNTCKYPPIGSIIILPDDVYKSSKIMLPKEGLCL